MMTDLMRWSPFDELWALGDQLERQLSQRSRAVRGSGVRPSASIVSSEDGWRLQVALPGVSPENVDVNVAGQTVHIRAIEREDTEKVSATFRHGLLELTLPLKETLKPRRIEISTEASKQLPNAA
ncbi:MAG: hypothetical protein AUJ01_11610 [Acidobacteria bacterium 13_1_40CM_3_65_5]|nr:MAG: hypothetical protein AUJ01_11610 [Acidobacteria bacterium 13_1_40CM_3_65_5]